MVGGLELGNRVGLITAVVVVALWFGDSYLLRKNYIFMKTDGKK
jgi:hypothetical protein